jgi:hypothetical protein
MSEERKPLAVVEDRIELAASPEVLWTCFADLGKWPAWFPALLEAKWISGSPWAIGAQFRQTLKFGFPLGKLTATATIIEISPSPFVAWRWHVAGMDAVHGYRFDAAVGGTEVLSRHEFYGFPAFLARVFFLIRRVHGIYQAALQGFKAYVETGTIQLRMPM